MIICHLARIDPRTEWATEKADTVHVHVWLSFGPYPQKLPIFFINRLLMEDITVWARP